MLATAAVILAAGQGTRMRSRVPKVLHPLAGRPMIDHVLDALASAGIEHPVVVIGFGAEQVEAVLHDRVPTVRQDPQLGTADAVRQAARHFSAYDAEHYLILAGDHLYRMDFCDLIETHVENGADPEAADLVVAMRQI